MSHIKLDKHLFKTVDFLYDIKNKFLMFIQLLSQLCNLHW